MIRLAIGIDIGGTNVVVGAVPEDGSSIHGVITEPTFRTGNSTDTVNQILRITRDVMHSAAEELGEGNYEIIGVGIGAPGPLDTRSGTVLLTPNLGWKNMPLRQLISDALDLPASLDNDANCAILGEWWQGAAQGGNVVVGLTIGTGIGGGLVMDGKIFHGASDIAGEIGHASIDTWGRRCKCGNYGCLEAYAAGPAIANRAVEGIEAGAKTELPEYVGGDLSAITAKTVSEAALKGDNFCIDVLRETAHFIGGAIASLVNILNPDIVVVCGGVTAAGDHLFEPLRNQVVRRAFDPAVRACKIVPGSLPGTAGVFGAVASFNAQREHSD